MTDTPNTYGMRPASSRVDRFCDACGQVDSDPHHMVGHTDGTTTSRHMDCCQLAGCPDGTCDAVLTEAGDKRHTALVKHLTSGGADHANYTAKENG